MAELIIAVDAVGIRALAGPITAAAILFARDAQEPKFEIHDPLKETRSVYTLDDPRKLPSTVLPLVVAHLKKMSLSFSCTHRSPGQIQNAREAAWDAMGQAAARCAERAIFTRRHEVQKGTDALEIYIPTGGHCPYALVGRIGQRPMATDWRRNAASVLAHAARTEVMHALHDKYPRYEFDKNQGNISKAHKLALRKYGRTPDHRG